MGHRSLKLNITLLVKELGPTIIKSSIGTTSFPTSSFWDMGGDREENCTDNCSRMQIISNTISILRFVEIVQ